jgi:isoleucyl-tRNA synthetase
MTEETKNDATVQDWRNTVFLPKTDFPMKAGLPQKEPGILARWESEKLYHKLRAARAGREKFILHDGPPYANGDMHIGHALNHILKDLVVRTQSLLGKDAPYVPGWDCHGLPIEWKVEEQYRKKKLNKDEVPVKEFRAECRAYAQNWVNVQREQLKRLGVNGDWDNPYLTMDFQAEATIVSELLKFAESGQLYRGSKPVMWSCVEKTALAEAEVEYEDITSTQIDVAFEMLSAPNCPAIQELIDGGEKVHAVVWTTTPWTIPVNQALAYGAEVEYVLVQFYVGLDSGVDPQFLDDPEFRFLGNHGSAEYLIAAPLTQVVAGRITQRLQAKYPNAGISVFVLPATERRSIRGSQLAGATARHPMWHLDNPPRHGEGDHAQHGGGGSPDSAGQGGSPPPSDLRSATSPSRGGFFSTPRPFLDGSSFVTTDAGTGLVHMSPDHGEDDFLLCKANGIEPVFAVEADGKYRADWAWMGGNGSVINPKLNAPDGPICSDLREAGALLSAAPFQHSYPHSWRSKAKLIYRCTPQWFVPMDKELPPSRLREGSGVGNPALENPPLTPPASGRGTLRETAVAAIAATRFIPEKGRNRLGAMVEGRPDWVLSRQRAWGVPITLFVNRKTGQYLNDPEVNKRIIAGVRAEGVDAWSDEAAQAYLGDQYALADYERVTDILDVWFDSGCTHAFTLESGRWPDMRWPADLYLEGSDQHRGWFQSSLLESCGTRGRAPYNAVLTHGFTMDAKGMKMSKSLGNTINPLDLMRDYGADILRMWTASVDFTEDHRIGKEILSGVADQYRKLRNTFRYLLGALDGFTDAERVDVADMPELERYVLHLLAELDGKLRQAVDDFDFNTYLRLITDFANNDLSAFFFDIRKDALYCEVNPATGYQTEKRRAYRTVLDILFNALVRYAAPVLVFTAEEVWTTRFGADAESVHLAEWPVVPFADADASPRHSRESGNPASGDVKDDKLDPRFRGDDGLVEKWQTARALRSLTNFFIEQARSKKEIGSSLEAAIGVHVDSQMLFDSLRYVDLAEFFIVSNVDVHLYQPIVEPVDEATPKISFDKTTHHKCGRCWRHLPEVSEDGALCGRCADVLSHV